MRADTKHTIRKKIEEYLSDREDVIFVYLFGSFADKDSFRDIDIALYMDPHPEMIRFGKLQAELDSLLEPKVDLVLLNDIPARNPAFAYEILSKGMLLLSRDRDLHTAYKSRAYQRYFDTAYLRKQFESAFGQRLKANKFGSRNYE